MSDRQASRRALLALGVVALCGGGALLGYVQSKRALAEPEALVPVPVTPRAATLLIGDSRIAQWPPDMLPPGAARIAWPGRTAASIARAAAPLLAAARPAHVVIQAGYNDASAAAFHGTDERRRILRAAAASIASLAEAGRAAGAERVTVLTVAPANDPGLARRLVYGGRHDEAVAWLNARLRALSPQGIRIVDADALLRGADGRLDPRYRSDASHWSDAAYRRIGEVVFAAPRLIQGPE